MKRTYITVLDGIITASILVSSISVQAATIKDFDSSSDYAKESITRLSQKDVIMGDQNGNFNPHKTATRAEMITIIVRALGIDTTNTPETSTFKDLPLSHWANKYVEAAYRSGIVKGISEDTFGVNNQCTREEMAAMFTRALGLTEEDIRGKQDLILVEKLTDKDKIAFWAKEYIELAMSTGLMKGSSSETFGPKDPAKREQAAIVLDRLLENKDSIKKLADGYTGKVQHPELFRALRNNFFNYKGNVKSSLEITINDKVLQEVEQTSLTMEGAINLKDYSFNVKLSQGYTGQDPLEIQYDLVHLGNMYYIRLANQNTWVAKTQEELAQLGVTTGDAEQIKARYEQFLRTYGDLGLTKSENSNINGINATKFEITLNDKATKALLPTLFVNNEVAEDENLEETFNNGYECKAVIYLSGKNQVVYESYSFTGNIKSEENEEDTVIRSKLEISYSNVDENVVIQTPVR